MERLFSGPVVVAIWGLMNAVAVALLAGYHAGSRGDRGDIVELYIYIGSALLVFLLALLAWLARRRRRQAIERGLVVPRRPASALMEFYAIRAPRK